MSSRTLWIGTYPEAGAGTPTGRGEGIWRAGLDAGTGTLSDVRQLAMTPAPSFLAHGSRDGLLYAVNEEDSGGLSVFTDTGDRLEQVAYARTGGVHPCHLVVEPRLGLVVATNYTSGSVAVFRLSADGLPEHDEPDQVIEFTGSGPNAERQRSSHAHFVVATPSAGHLLVTDLGGDVVRRFSLDAASRALVDAGVAVRLPPGSGPRHAAFAADGKTLLVLGELDGRLHTVRWDATSDTGEWVASTGAQAAAGPPPQLAHIERDGDEFSLGCRGSDLISVHRVQPDGSTRHQRDLPLPGSCPRHHAVVDGWLVVAQQERGGITVLTRDGEERGRAAVPSPACVLAAG